jgi:hypothetical protein
MKKEGSMKNTLYKKIEPSNTERKEKKIPKKKLKKDLKKKRDKEKKA